MKSRGLIIVLIILLVIIIFGLVMFLVTALNGGISMGFFSIGMKKSDTIVFQNTYEAERIDNIEIKSAAGEVVFKEGTAGLIEVVAYGKENSRIDVDFKGNKLDIDYSKGNSNFVFFGKYSRDIIVYIPRNYAGNIKVSNDYGECKLCNLENATIDIDAACGSIEVGKIKDAILKCDCGNVKIDELLNRCDIDVDCGDVKIQNANFQANSAIKCDLGNVKINRINDVYVDANVDLGNSKVSKSNKDAPVTVKIEVDCGDIKVE